VAWLSLAKHDTKGIVRQIKERRLTYLTQRKLLQLIKTIKEIESKQVEGRFVEAGCALGGSLVLIAAYAPGREISVYDTFEMIPAPGDEDPPEVHERYATIQSGKSKGIGGDVYYGYRGDLREFVTNQIHEAVGVEAVNRTHLHKGLLQDTMALEGPVAFAHIDVDWYDPVKTCIVRLWPLLPRGGVLIFDDYFDWGGCKKAVDEFFLDRTDMKCDSTAGNFKVTKL
jgi:asparagine synthase (glutamine-hydrolysing)